MGEKLFGVFLDDERLPEDVTWVNYPDNVTWVVVSSPETFNYAVKRLEEKCYDYFVSFDHDIQVFVNSEEITGYDILKKMVDEQLYGNKRIPECYFHTQNPIGKKNMQMYYNNAKECQNEPYIYPGIETENYLKEIK